MKFKWQHPGVPQTSRGCLSRAHWIQKGGEESLFIVATSGKEIKTVFVHILEQLHREVILTKISLKYMFKDFSLLEITGKGELGENETGCVINFFRVRIFCSAQTAGVGEHGKAQMSGPGGVGLHAHFEKNVSEVMLHTK